MNKRHYKSLFLIVVLYSASFSIRAIGHSVLPLHVNPYIQDCHQRISFRVEYAEQFLTALRWYEQYVFDKNLGFLPICFELPTGISHVVDERSDPFQSDAQVIFINGAKAFVRGDKLHISTSHPYHVLIHELAHLVYFADEYALSDRLLAQQCHWQGYANKRPSSLMSSEDYLWELLEQVDAKIIDEQCTEYTGKRWYKIKHAKWHFLHYSDLSYIPRIYQHLWQYRLQEFARAAQK